MDADQQLYLKARKHTEDKVGFLIHFLIYASVNVFVFLMWWTTTPGAYPWFWFMTAGWGIGVVGHFIAVFLGEGYVESSTQRELRRLKGQGQ